MLLVESLIEIVGHLIRLHAMGRATGDLRLILVACQRALNPAILESDCWVLKSLWESSVPGSLLVLISSQIRLGPKAIYSVQGSSLSIDTSVNVTILHFLRFESNLKSPHRIIRLKQRIYPYLCHFLVFEAYSKRILHRLQLLPRNLNVDRI